MKKDTTIKKKSTKAYMGSYEWNYMVLDIVDYLEQKLKEPQYKKRMFPLNENKPDPWENFKVYCDRRNLNWRVIKKMIEYTVYDSFDSELQMENHKAFLPQPKDPDNITGPSGW